MKREGGGGVERGGWRGGKGRVEWGGREGGQFLLCIK